MQNEEDEAWGRENRWTTAESGSFTASKWAAKNLLTIHLTHPNILILYHFVVSLLLVKVRRFHEDLIMIGKARVFTLCSNHLHLDSQPYRIRNLAFLLIFAECWKTLRNRLNSKASDIEPVSALVEGSNFVQGTGRYEAINVRDLKMGCSVGHVEAEIHRQFATSMFLQNVRVCQMSKKVRQSHAIIGECIAHSTLHIIVPFHDCQAAPRVGLANLFPLAHSKVNKEGDKLTPLSQKTSKHHHVQCKLLENKPRTGPWKIVIFFFLWICRVQEDCGAYGFWPPNLRIFAFRLRPRPTESPVT